MRLRIEKTFESKFLIKFISSIIISFSIVLVSLYVTLPRSDVMHYYEAVASFVQTSDSLVRVFIIAGIIEFVFIAIIIQVISILASHKLAGPIYRLEKVLEGLADGDLTHTVRFRYYDPFKVVARHFNDSVKEFVERIRSVNEANNNVNKAREGLDGTAESIDKFKKEMAVLEKEFEKFKL